MASPDYWMSKKEYDAWKDFYAERERLFVKHVLWGEPWPKREAQPDDNVKLAYVIVNGQRVMAGVDNQTLQAYELNDTTPTWKMPLVPMNYDKFDRWCRLMDV